MKKLNKAVLMLATLMTSSAAFAADATGNAAQAATTAAATGSHYQLGMAAGYIAIAAGIAIGLAALGGGFGQGRAAAAALDGVARNPSASTKIMVQLILSLALIESLVIYALIVALDLAGSKGLGSVLHVITK